MKVIEVVKVEFASQGFCAAVSERVEAPNSRGGREPDGPWCAAACSGLGLGCATRCECFGENVVSLSSFFFSQNFRCNLRTVP